MDWKLLDKVKVLAIQGLVSDDDLMEKLVLKGGNAIDLIHNAYQRGSLDLDFSIEDDFQDIELPDLEKKVKELLERSFQEAHLVAHDVHLTRRPSQVPTELASFWGGYRIEFKVLPEGLFNELSGDVEAIRHRCSHYAEVKKDVRNATTRGGHIHRCTRSAESNRRAVITPP